MEQHPIPQQISSYEFRLVGDMTLKQFLKLAGGVVVGLIIYYTHLPGLLRLPLSVGAIAFGAALAFVPINDRPLETWILAFFKAVYSPTLYVWQKSPTQLEVLAEEKEEIPVKPTQPPVSVKTAKTKEEKLKEFVRTLNPKGVKPKFGNVPVPEPPKIPNLLVGMVLAPDGKLVEDAIVEIQNKKGVPVRALRTNKIGQFRIATPLPNGEYYLLVEKEGLEFKPIKLVLEGKIVPPLRIEAKAK